MIYKNLNFSAKCLSKKEVYWIKKYYGIKKDKPLIFLSLV